MLIKWFFVYLYLTFWHIWVAFVVCCTVDFLSSIVRPFGLFNFWEIHIWHFVYQYISHLPISSNANFEIEVYNWLKPVNCMPHAYHMLYSQFIKTVQMTVASRHGICGLWYVIFVWKLVQCFVTQFPNVLSNGNWTIYELCEFISLYNFVYAIQSWLQSQYLYIESSFLAPKING